MTAPAAAGDRERARARIRAAEHLRAAALALFGAALLASLVAPAFLPAPGEGQLTEALQPPMWAGGTTGHPLGTDALGRDMLSRLVAGAQTSLLVGFAAVGVSAAAGVALGLVSAYAGRWADWTVSWAIDVFAALPLALLAVAITGIIERSVLAVVLTIALLVWPATARLVRGEVMRLRRVDFVVAAASTGCSPARILARHLLPNIASPLVVLLAVQFSTVIAVEASLSFLRLGVPTSEVSWGGMLADGRDYVGVDNRLLAYPSLALAGTCVGVNLFSDWLRERLRP